MVSWNDGEPSLWNVLTVNLNSLPSKNCAYIDVNNNGEEILAWIKRNKLAVPTGRCNGRKIKNGFRTVPDQYQNVFAAETRWTASFASIH